MTTACCDGERAGYFQHRRRGEQPCPTSSTAHTTYSAPLVRANNRAHATLARENPTLYLLLTELATQTGADRRTARRRARQQLAAQLPDRHRHLYQQELALLLNPGEGR